MDKKFNHWSEVKTAWLVAKYGTLSSAADKLNVHRATVLRHIDTLEEVIGEKLFQRHSKGYVPTEAGKGLLHIGALLDDQLSQWRGSIQRNTIQFTGELIITGLEVLSVFVLPFVREFYRQHPKVITRYIATTELLKLEYGNAHVAFRAGPKPQDQDYIVQPFCILPIGMYAHDDYIEKYGKPSIDDGFNDHFFVGPENEDAGIPHFRWLKKNVTRERVIMRSSNQRVLGEAVKQGIGIGCLLRYEANRYSCMQEVIEPLKEWEVPVWMLTHVDLHRSAKVQAFMSIVKDSENHSDLFKSISSLRANTI
ncbi:MAG: LysR family transcriptional regulator [Pseudomonadota bacterium]